MPRTARPSRPALLGATGASTALALVAGALAAAPAATAATTVDMTGRSLVFGGAATRTVLSGDGKSVGNVIRYNDVASVGGLDIDAVVTTTAIAATTITDYDTLDSAGGGAGAFSINMNTSAAGSARFRIQFYEADSYVGSGTGIPVVLRNVTMTSVDLDSQSSTEYQYTDFSGFQTYTVRNDTNLLAPTQPAGTNRVRFQAGVAGNRAADKKDQVTVTYSALSEIEVAFGAVAAATNYFAVHFGTPVWDTASVNTQTNPHPFNRPPVSTSTSRRAAAGATTVLPVSAFGSYSDPDTNPLAKVRITSLPASGALLHLVGQTWTPVTAGEEFSVDEIDLGTLRYRGDGTPASLGFRVHDGLELSTATYTLALTPVLQPQTISFPDPGRVLPSTTLAPTVSATSGLPVTLTSETPGTCTVDNGVQPPTVTTSGSLQGPCVVTATQTGNATWDTALEVTRIFAVSPRTSQTLSFPDPGTQGIGSFPTTTSAGASASSGLPITLATYTPTVCTVAGGSITYVATGMCRVRVTQDGNGTYAFGSRETRTYLVQLATYTVQYDANGGSGSIASQVFTAGGSTTVAAGTAMTRPVHAFTGWNTGADGSGTAYAPGASYSALAGATLYAQWSSTNHAPVYTAAPTNTAQTVGRGTAPVALAATDADGDALAHTLLSGSLPAGVVLSAAGTFSGAATTRGVSTATVRVTDTHGASGTTTLVVTVPNTAPAWTAATTNTAQTVVRGGRPVALGATDADSEPVTFTHTGGTLPPGLALAAGGTFTGAATTPGTYPVVVTAADGQGGSTPVNLVLVVTVAAPLAVTDTASTPAGQAVSLDVLPNDSDPASYALSVTSVTQPAHGGAVLGSGGNVTYTPAPGWSGTDSFTYALSNGHGGAATGTVTIAVVPLAAGDTATVDAGGAVTRAVLANDTGTLDAATVSVSAGPSHGTTAVSAAGEVTYAPAAGFSGTDALTYSVRDGAGRQASAVLTLTVLPRAVDDALTVPAGGSGTVDVLANDLGGLDPAALVVGAAPAHGTAAVTPSHTVGYVPAAGFVGTDTLTYSVADAAGRRTTATVTVTVPLPAAPAAPPVASTGRAGTNQAQVVPVPTGGSVALLDAAGVPASLVEVAGEGTYALDVATGTITFVPAPGFRGTAKGVAYRVVDAYGQVVSSSYVPTVRAVPAAPVAPVTPAPAPTPVAAAKAKELTVVSEGKVATTPVVCRLSEGTVARCAVTLTASVDGRPQVTGKGSVSVGAGKRPASVVVPVVLNALGRSLAAQPGGRRMKAVAEVTVRGSKRRLTATSVTNVVSKRVLVLRPVFFDSDSYTISSADERYLAGLRGKLKGTRTVSCIGFTDSEDSDSYNMWLAGKRAQVVCTFLLKGTGVRTRTVTKGESAPHATNATPAGRALNRRTEITLTY